MSEKEAHNYPEEVETQEQKLDSRGAEHKMPDRPRASLESYKGADKLKDLVAIITGGDSGIGRSIAILFAREGADIAILYDRNDKDADETCELVKKEGRKCISIKGDIGSKQHCTDSVEKVYSEFNKLDILVNNAAVQFEQKNIENISEEQLELTFRTNIYSQFFLTQAALKYLHKSKNPSIINNTSINAFRGHPSLIDYTSTKAAIVGFTRSMSQNLSSKGIRVNMVAPGPIWTPLIVSSFDEEHQKKFGKNTPLERPGQPEEVAPAFVFLASSEASYITGQVIHVNGGNCY